MLLGLDFAVVELVVIVVVMASVAVASELDFAAAVELVVVAAELVVVAGELVVVGGLLLLQRSLLMLRGGVVGVVAIGPHVVVGEETVAQVDVEGLVVIWELVVELELAVDC